MNEVFRNGDWNITKTDKKLSGKKMKHSGSFVFAEGEATGHYHTIVVERPEDLTVVKTETGDYIFTTKSDARITHPEHSMKNDLVIPAGTYYLNQRREKDWMQMTVRKVID